MKVLNDTISLFKNFAPGLKLFLLTYLVVVVLLPINHMFNTEIQTTIGEFQFKYIHAYVRRIIVAIVTIYAFLINDPMLMGLVVMFILHKTEWNYASAKPGVEGLDKDKDKVKDKVKSCNS